MFDIQEELGLAQVSLCVAAVPLILVFVAVPLLIFFFPNLMQHLFFLNFRRMPLTDYENVSANGVRAIGRSFYLEGDQGKIGVWHMIPISITQRYRDGGVQPTDAEVEAVLEQDKHPVIVYAHGNSFDRTINHRCELYNVLTDMDYHVVAFDYRGYGDSEGSPTEEGIVNDTRIVYDYVRQKAAGKMIVVWGHSMGTGVSTKLVQDLSLERKAPEGLVLEAAFNNLRDVVMNHPFSLPLRWMPNKLLNALLLNPLRSAGLIMDSDLRIAKITCPVLIMHAEDDHVIPSRLGRMLAEAARTSNVDVEFLEFESKREYRHKFIYKAPELSEIVRKFVNHCEEKMTGGKDSSKLRS